jgi:hypothetical protein
VLCCQGRALALAGPLRHTLARTGLALELVPELSTDIVAWSPLTYAQEVEGWELRPLAGAALPDNLLAIRGLAIRGGLQVRTLGHGWMVVGRLQLAGMARLETLDGPLEVFGDLDLDGLPRLRELGREIRVHGNLTLAGCPALGGWPEDLRVAGAIWMDRAGPDFRPGNPDLAGRVVTPWPGIRPRPVPMAPLPAAILGLV